MRKSKWQSGLCSSWRRLLDEGCSQRQVLADVLCERQASLDVGIIHGSRSLSSGYPRILFRESANQGTGATRAARELLFCWMRSVARVAHRWVWGHDGSRGRLPHTLPMMMDDGRGGSKLPWSQAQASLCSPQGLASRGRGRPMRAWQAAPPSTIHYPLIKSRGGGVLRGRGPAR